MTESLLSLSNILLFGRKVADLQITNPDSTTLSTDVHVATTTRLNALQGHLTVDDIVLLANKKVLVKDQGNPNENGIYTVGAAPADWVRDTTIVNATRVAVSAGTVNKDTDWFVRQSVQGNNIHYRFDTREPREGRRRGVNRQLGEQLSDPNACFAKIYGFS